MPKLLSCIFGKTPQNQLMTWQTRTESKNSMWKSLAQRQQFVAPMFAQIFTSGRISSIDTGTGPQYSRQISAQGLQRRVAFENAAFSRDPSLWRADGEHRAHLVRIHVGFSLLFSYRFYCLSSDVAAKGFLVPSKRETSP